MGEQKLTKEDVSQNLLDAGFAPEAAAGFLECWCAGNQMEQRRLLARQRRYLLERIHCREKQISCLDYLAYQLKRSAIAIRDNKEMTKK